MLPICTAWTLSYAYPRNSVSPNQHPTLPRATDEVTVILFILSRNRVSFVVFKYCFWAVAVPLLVECYPNVQEASGGIPSSA